MRTIILDIIRSAAVVSALTAGTVFSQQYYPSNPFRADSAPTPVYVAEASPASRNAPPQTVEYRNDSPVPPPPQTAGVKDEKKSNSLFSWFSNPWSSKKTKPDETEQEDDGLDRVAAINRERRYSEQDYIASVTQPQGTAAKDQYLTGMQAERQGNYGAAVQAYHHFIRLNKSRTQNGILAAPYHRLAVISWKQRNDVRNAETYFRYAIKYAQGANFLIITGDFAQFFMEQGEFEQAEILLRNGLLQDHDNQRLLVHLARCKARQDRPVEAMRYLTQVYGKEQGYQELAVMYRQQGNHAMARGVEEKRERYLASVYQPADVYYASRQVSGTGMAPTTSPPVMPQPRGMGHMNPVYPFPTIEPNTQERMPVQAQWEAAPPTQVPQAGQPVTPLHPGHREMPQGGQPLPATNLYSAQPGVIQTTYTTGPFPVSTVPAIENPGSDGIFPVYYPTYPSSNQQGAYRAQY